MLATSSDSAFTVSEQARAISSWLRQAHDVVVLNKSRQQKRVSSRVVMTAVQVQNQVAQLSDAMDREPENLSATVAAPP